MRRHPNDRYGGVFTIESDVDDLERAHLAIQGRLEPTTAVPAMPRIASGSGLGWRFAVCSVSSVNDRCVVTVDLGGLRGTTVNTRYDVTIRSAKRGFEYSIKAQRRPNPSVTSSLFLVVGLVFWVVACFDQFRHWYSCFGAAFALPLFSNLFFPIRPFQVARFLADVIDADSETASDRNHVQHEADAAEPPVARRAPDGSNEVPTEIALSDSMDDAAGTIRRAAARRAVLEAPFFHLADGWVPGRTAYVLLVVACGAWVYAGSCAASSAVLLLLALICSVAYVRADDSVACERSDEGLRVRFRRSGERWFRWDQLTAVTIDERSRIVTYQFQTSTGPRSVDMVGPCLPSTEGERRVWTVV